MAKRRSDQLRPIKITRNYTKHAGGSVLYESGDTKVLCTASFIADQPGWRKGSELGWLTAEYSMLPSSTHSRKSRPRNGHTDSRGTEIQRLIGRALRNVIDFEKLGPNTIYIDCDVIQADGGTRTAAINGGYVALVDAIDKALKQKLISENPIVGKVGAISVGIVNGKNVLDLDYQLDSTADVDMNVVMTEKCEFIELQGTGERTSFTHSQLNAMLKMAEGGIKKIFKAQTLPSSKKRK
ncbi:MAG: ribonuclease PH [Phycisphaerae bacterium]|nr:ribonuclease PH [Phycisphaerae bacterium]